MNNFKDARAMRGEPDSMLQGDVLRYDSFGLHRTGSAGAEAALDWIAAELDRAGLDVSEQRFTVARQYRFDEGMLHVGTHEIAVVPQWWLPEDCASFTRSGRIGGGAGDFNLLELPYDQGAYLSGTQKDAIARAAANGARVILLCIGHPSGELFTYNVAQTDTPWPVPVVLVAPKDVDKVRTAGSASLRVQGSWQRDIPARNIVARTRGRTGRDIVVSTPVTSWFTSTGERAPGIACFLALARQAAARWPHHGFTFVGTSGHEVGHGGMETFLLHEAPSPASTSLWLHLGASLACHPCERHEGDWRSVPGSPALPRFALASEAMAGLAGPLLAQVGSALLTGAAAAIGELREVHHAGYPRFAGMIGQNPLFHTPADRAFATSGVILAPVLASFEAMMDDIDSNAG